MPIMSSTVVTSIQPERSVRHATIADLNAVVAVHQKAFAGSLLTRLGPRFLELYYSTVLRYPNHIFLVSTHGTSVLAFVSGFLEPARFYKLMEGRGLQMGITILRRIASDPGLLVPAFYGTLRVLRNATVPSNCGCELSSLAVDPQTAGEGIGTTLVNAFLQCAWERNAKCVRLTTDAATRANVFYLRLGFRLTRQELRGKVRLMNEYSIPRPGAFQAPDPEEVRNTIKPPDSGEWQKP